MRGTVCPEHTPALHTRITPAHAGNSQDLDWKAVYMWDHPRTCGEQLTGMKDEMVRAGSPPHMRGTAIVTSSAVPAYGITPAHAGNSVSHIGLFL